MAWAGESAVAKVEVSIDGGKSWSPARLLGDDVPHTWRLWEREWTPAAAGSHALLARASDVEGRSQPLERDSDRRNYVINHMVPVSVVVR
jgi:hypothetical protein